MNKLKKIVYILLTVVIVGSGFPTQQAIAAPPADNTYIYTNYWYDYAKLTEFYSDITIYNSDVQLGKIATHIGGNPFPQYITVGGRKLYLNYKILKQKNLYVYGNYSNVPGNYFKCGYQIHEDLAGKDPYLYYGNGYFKKPDTVECKGLVQNPKTHGNTCKVHAGNGTVRGEWKYLGYDVSGNPFSNMWMINVATATSFAERDWQLEPWSNELKGKTGLGRINDYNEGAYRHERGEVKTKTQEWIASTINKMAGYDDVGIPTKNPVYANQGGRSFEAYKFLYVQSPPTIKQSGSAKMWHKRPNGELWYQTFSIPTLAAKKLQPAVSCTVNITSTIEELPEGTGADNEKVTLEFQIKGKLEDDPYWQDFVAKTAYYTRSEIATWDMILEIPGLGIKGASAKKLTKIPHASEDKNETYTTIKVETKVSELKKLPRVGKDYELSFEATATPIYIDAEIGKTGKGNNKYLIGTISPPPVKLIEGKIPVVIDIPDMEIKNNIGEIAFDGVRFEDAVDNTDRSAMKSTELYINGQEIDYHTFFSGNYTFPPTTDKNGYFAEVICKYNLDGSKIIAEGLPPEAEEKLKNNIPMQLVSKDYVYVYPTKPNAQFKISSNTWKENRIINIENNSASGNIALVLAKYPITEYRWTYGGDTSKLNKGTDTGLIKQLQYKAPGGYSLTLECKNTLGKWSEPYTVEFQVLEDIAPNIEVNLTDSVLTRKDEISAWHYSVNSTDGDKIAIAKIELWYDSDNNGTLETKIQEWNGLGTNGVCELSDFPKYMPDKLGYYKYKISAKDEFVGVPGQDTLTQYITEASKKSRTYEVEFWVDNYQPLSDLYLEKEIVRPKIDLYIMRDKNLAQEKYTFVSENRVTYENALLGRNIIPSIKLWDMKTYEYSTSASTSRNTGSSYPDYSTSYSSGGYSGTLYRDSVINNWYERDEGRYEQSTESKSISESYTNTTTITNTYSTGRWYETSWQTQQLPETKSYNSGGFSGTLTKGSGTAGAKRGTPPSNPKQGDTYTSYQDYHGYYTGTVYKTVDVWVPRMVRYDNYTGYYSGTIYKYVRQDYSNPWRDNTHKYILYLSDGNIAELTDFNTAKSKSDAKVILAGSSAITAQHPSYAKYINTSGKTIQQVMDEAINYIAEDTPAVEKMVVLPNEIFTLKYGESDLEGDTIVSRQYQVVQDPDYFDNGQGFEINAMEGYDEDEAYWRTAVPTKFSKVGKYSIFRRVKDKPTGPYGDKFSYYSGVSQVDIYVHRKPIALAELDWDFNAASGTYKTTWTDKSYDLDHNVTRADKGIMERKIMWRKDGGEWHYTIPDHLAPGTYNLHYSVKDIEGAWSDSWIYNFTLAASPPMQFAAKLRAEDHLFRTPPSPVTLPAGESLQVYDAWTRYPSNPFLTAELLNISGTRASPVKTINYSLQTGTKSVNDILWHNISYAVPPALPDGNYTFQITAKAEQSKTISFPVILKTPINLKAQINGKSQDAQVNAGENNLFVFHTSKYVTSVQLMFEGAAYSSSSGQIRLLSNDGKVKTWRYETDLADSAGLDGRTGTAEFKAYLPSGASETANVNYKIVGIRASNFLVTMILDVGWRPYYFDLSKGIDDNRDGIADRYARKTGTDIGTLKLPVNYYSLVGHSRTYVKAGYKIKGQITILGSPDWARFRISYQKKGTACKDHVNLIKSGGDTYHFEWIIPADADNGSFASFDLMMAKNAREYGNEKWMDAWDSRNIDRKVLYIKGNVYEDITFVQSH